MPSGDFRPPSAEWQQGYDAGYREAQQDAALTDAPSPTEPPCGDDSWDTRYECVKPSGHPVEGPGLTSHEYRYKRAAPGVAPSRTEDPGIAAIAGHVCGQCGRSNSRRVAPSPDAPGLLAALDEFAPSLAPDYPRYARWLRAKEAIRAALAASGDTRSPDAPDWERLYTEEAERYARLSNVHAKCAPSPTEDPYGFGPGYERHQHGDGEWCWRKVAPSPDAPEPTTIGGVVHLHGRDVPCADEFVGECVLRAALAASGDAPREGLDVERLYAAIVAELVVLWGEPSDAVSTQVRPIVARNIADRYVASESHPTKERTDG